MSQKPRAVAAERLRSPRVTSLNRVLATLFVVVLVALVARAARKEGGVLERNRDFGARSLAGEDPYEDVASGQRIHGPYPPSFVLVAAPLAVVPERAARIAWACAQAGALLGLWFLLRGWARTYWPERAEHASVFFAA